MATIKILCNGQEMNYNETMAQLMRQIITTKYTTLGVATAAAKMANRGEAVEMTADGEGLKPESVALGEVFLSALLARGSESDVYEVVVTDGKAEENEGKATRIRIANKVRFALHPELWASDLPVKAAGDKAPRNKGIPDLDIL